MTDIRMASGATHRIRRINEGSGVSRSILVTPSLVAGLLIAVLWSAQLVTPDPFRRMTERFPHIPQVVMGALMGGFLIGRPYPLFYRMFQYAASTHNGFYGALSFILVASGNILVMAILFLALATTRLPRWLQAQPTRIASFTAGALLVGGAFTFFYWAVRLPANFGYGWFPHAPWH